MGNSVGQAILDDPDYKIVNKYDIMLKRAQGRSTKHKNYKERLFVLTPKALLYYDGKTPDNRGDFKGAVLLRNITKIELVNESVLHKSHCFLIEHVGLSLFIIAYNEEKRMSWIQAVREACFRINGSESDSKSRSCSDTSLIRSINSLDSAENRQTRIWAKAYDSFEFTHPRVGQNAILERFGVLTTFVPEIPFGTNLKSISVDIIVKIFSYLTVKDLYKLRLVCKEWDKVVDKASLWKSCTMSNIKDSVVMTLCGKFGTYIEKTTLRTISGNITNAFKYLENVRYLNLDYSQLDFNAIPFACPKLKELSLNNCKLVSTINEPDSNKKLNFLKKLQFKFTESFKQDTIQNLLDTCPNITYLLLAGSVRLRASVFESTPHLTELKLEFINLDATQIATYCPNLTKLSLMWLKFIGPTSGSLIKLEALTIR